ncbi:MAG: ABC transporter ATP-binding protein [Gemmataceae bacterium]|nr:ABC transporter ATP-binding protein [Gemmataceae bacterium]MCI0741316.1 ABC transporter ATP-binding protein [Gemmataceae bacterium]
MHIAVETPIQPSPRVQQLYGLFDLPLEKASRVTWNVDLPLDARPWHVGLIVGPSGCGKSTVARHYFSEMAELDKDGRPRAFAEWVARGAVVDAFPLDLPIKQIALLLSSVGFSSPPAWLRPFHVLSTGQQFRVTLALLLAHAAPAQRIVFDEYTSVVDRTVAQIGSHALAKTVRQRGQQFVAITCHEDVEDWLQPDWVYRPAENSFAWRRLRRRPSICLHIVRCRASAWPLFAPHHYLSERLHKSAVCFLATWQERPVAFSAWLPYYGPGRRTRREHRTVTLPDYQGAGIGNALSDFCAAFWTGLGYRTVSTTTHPAMIRARLASPHWALHRAPSLADKGDGKVRHATTRLTAGFTYVGPPLPAALAEALLEDLQPRSPRLASH